MNFNLSKLVHYNERQIKKKERVRDNVVTKQELVTIFIFIHARYYVTSIYSGIHYSNTSINNRMLKIPTLQNSEI